MIGSPIVRGTVDNWLGEGASGPKMGAPGRDSMYQVAFAMKLDVEKTIELFNKVYLDRPFLPRQVEDLIYYHCLKNGRSYQDARRMIDEVKQGTKPGESAVDGTMYIKSMVEETTDDCELVEYIRNHPSNFTGDNYAGKAKLEQYFREITGTKESYGLAYKLWEYRYSDSDTRLGRQPYSRDFALAMMLQGDGTGKRSSDTKMLRKAIKRHEIVNQFPNKDTILTSTSSYILRKNLILVYFCWYWMQEILENRGNNDAFVDTLNALLAECGYSALYCGNPYDCMFLYCAACHNKDVHPLDVFHDVITPEE